MKSSVKKFVSGIGGMFIFSLILVSLLATPEDAQATHYRYGNISWQQVQGFPNRIQFNISMAWRRSFYGSPTVGSVVNVGSLNFGDGGGASIALTVTSVNVAEDWFYGTATLTRQYASPGNRTAFFTNCCRISSLQNNADQSFRLETVVNVGAANSAPVTTLPPIVNLSTGLSPATFNIPYNDPDGNPVTFRLATGAEVGGLSAAGFAVSSTGTATFSTVGKTIGNLYNAAVVLEDGQTKSIVDFLIRIVATSTPPFFDYSVTPPNGYIYKVSPGQAVNFTVRANDADPGDVVNLQAVGLPVGVSHVPALPANGTPVQSSFSWTPSASQLGTFVISYIAQDLAGVQVTTSVVIEVSQKPVFDVPPTPSDFSMFQFEPGMNINYTFQASDPDPLDLVQIISFANFPPAATLSDALPTTAGNPTSTDFAWVASPSDWGLHSFVLTAQDGYGDQATHNLDIVINSQPFFTSTPVTEVLAGTLYTYNITTDDPDLPYGDLLDVLGSLIPSWLTLTDNGDGTATLSGTPTFADGGSHNVGLVVEDIYHHGYPNPANNEQLFSILVTTCNMTATASDDAVVFLGYSPLDCTTLSVVQTTGTTGALSYAWSSGDNTASATVCPVTSTNYSVTVTDANGCTATDDVYVTVYDTRCGKDDDKVKICITSPSGQKNTICVSAEGAPSVLANNPNASAGDCNLVAAKTTGISAGAANSASVAIFAVYPNPGLGSFNIIYSGDEAANRISIMNLQGQVVKEFAIEASDNVEMAVDVKELSAGAYFLNIMNDASILKSTKYMVGSR